MRGELGCLRSGTRYTVERGDHFPEQFPSAHRRVRSNPPIFNEEELAQVRPITPLNTLGRQVNPTVPIQIGSNSQNPVSSQGTPSVQQPHQVCWNRMADDIKLPVFRGTGLENPDQHWFLCEAVWSIKKVTEDDIKMA